MYRLGVDPGKGGGFAVISMRGEIAIYNKFTCWQDIWLVLKEYRSLIKHCAIEKVSSMSGQGVKSTFTFGMNYGGWLAYLEIFKISHTLVPPQRWQKMFLGSFPKGESKIRSVDFINRRYPHVNLKKSHHGISDAICLALYALAMDRRLSKETDS